MTKNGNKPNVALIESISPSLIVTCIFLLRSIHMDYGFIFQDKVKCTSFNVNLKHQYQNVINKIIFAKNKIHKVCTQLPNSYY